ncbi:dna repair [Lecanosticta acicola]|uniref:Dolichyl-diphosphooligosaccharide-protein glycosyltransferase subunit OST5 n=1 Tax=Lecanosticta acicola TaxID=111012 RepID=A0AAI8YP30_9PEZI|nr:dna repair [Lecanosticta acicola]
MSSQPLHALWDASAKTPFQPAVSKDAQFTVGFSLLVAAFILSGLFGLNLSLKNLPLLGIPASLAFGFGAVYMICAVGVYV